MKLSGINNNNQHHVRHKEGKHFIKHNSQQNHIEIQNNNFYKIHDSNSNGKLVSKLLIKKLRSDHKGVFTCKCDDGAEAKYVVESNYVNRGTCAFFNIPKFAVFPLLCNKKEIPIRILGEYLIDFKILS